MRFPGIAYGTIFLFLASCASTARDVPPVSLANPSSPSAPLPAEEYRIQPGDLLDIKFFYSPELNEQMPVRPDGRIALQLVGDVVAAGSTPAELTKVVKEKYSQELKKPDVTVIVRTFGNQRVYVDGEVSKPGVFPLTGPTTVLQAIAQAGGFVYTGDVTEVMVIRRGPRDEPIALRLNLEKVRDMKDMSQDVYLKPFDIVYVPKTSIANANLWIEQYLNRMVPRIGFTYAWPAGNGIMGIDTTTTIVTPVR